MNAPELMNVSPLKGVNKEGKAARDALLSKITEVQPTVRTVFGVPSLVLATPVPVVIVTLKDKGEKYGRWLAKVYATQADGTQLFVNDWMIANNFAVPFMT
jgi:endonuclease YncB( thermonuclease family)